MSKPDIDAAAQFIARSARVLDRRRFDRLFGGGPAGPVRDAVAAYRNPDGGFGHALEPDGRSPGSQPAAIELGLRILDGADAWDADLVEGACDWLGANAPAEGGAVFVEPSVQGWPHAPWWAPTPGRAPSLVSTGQIAGTLHKRGVSHPWLDRATELLWSLIGELDDPGPYDLRGALRFLDHVPDAGRARQALATVKPMVDSVVTLDPRAPGETHSPLDFAPEPGTRSRELFSPDVIEAHLDHLAASQQEDGGWMFNFPVWCAATELDWRGHITVDVLRILRAHR
ncbi:MAG TPA: hypothetical protein VH637_08880 [Streptosporangiaceae bacterium]|jgi:hypothetical protein